MRIFEECLLPIGEIFVNNLGIFWGGPYREVIFVVCTVCDVILFNSYKLCLLCLSIKMRGSFDLSNIIKYNHKTILFKFLNIWNFYLTDRDKLRTFVLFNIFRLTFLIQSCEDI